MLIGNIYLGNNHSLNIIFSQIYEYIKTYVIYILQNGGPFLPALKGTTENLQVEVVRPSFPYCMCSTILNLLWQYFQIWESIRTTYFDFSLFYGTMILLYICIQNSVFCICNCLNKALVPETG